MSKRTYTLKASFGVVFTARVDFENDKFAINFPGYEEATKEEATILINEYRAWRDEIFAEAVRVNGPENVQLMDDADDPVIAQLTF